MPEQLTAVQAEYRQLKFRVFKGVVVLAVIPFVLTAIATCFAVPSIVLKIGMAATMLGILIAVIYIRRVWRCPAYGSTFSYGHWTLGGKCLACHVQLYIPRYSKDGSRIYP
jgi:hypothetical protein